MHRSLVLRVAGPLVACFALVMVSATPAAIACPGIVTGHVVDGETGRPAPGISIAVIPLDAVNEAEMLGDRPPAEAMVTTTDDSGHFSVASPRSPFLLDAYGSPTGRVTFHGRFRAGDVGTIRLLRPTRDERAALTQLNAFRAAHGITATLGFDENLMESARYWAALEGRAQRIGHTCAALDNPQGCVEFNVFYHRLPGAPRDWLCGQNAAFDTVSSWIDPDQGFEDEEHQTSGERGHYINIVSANRWIGFGKVGVPGVGTYFAMNVL